MKKGYILSWSKCTLRQILLLICQCRQMQQLLGTSVLKTSNREQRSPFLGLQPSHTYGRDSYPAAELHDLLLDTIILVTTATHYAKPIGRDS